VPSLQLFPPQFRHATPGRRFLCSVVRRSLFLLFIAQSPPGRCHRLLGWPRDFSGRLWRKIFLKTLPHLPKRKYRDGDVSVFDTQKLFLQLLLSQYQTLLGKGSSKDGKRRETSRRNSRSRRSRRFPHLFPTLHQLNLYLLFYLMGDQLRTEKINRIREQIEQHTYHIFAEEVAKALLQTERFFLSRGEKKSLRTCQSPRQKGGSSK
jgi:anti-sigma28 factor (negative regulator of flagellin synthesis)